jgi:hypothetical protein
VSLARADAVLIHEYNFNTSTVVDSVGAINGTLVGGASTVGGVLNLDGSDDYVQLNRCAITIGAFSITFNAASTGQGPHYVGIALSSTSSSMTAR